MERRARQLVRSIAAASVATLLAAGTAHALSEWWTPSNTRCPTFDTADACQAYCGPDPSRCGGSDQCTFRTGTSRPECIPPPVKDRNADGWERNDQR